MHGWAKDAGIGLQPNHMAMVAKLAGNSSDDVGQAPLTLDDYQNIISFPDFSLSGMEKKLNSVLDTTIEVDDAAWLESQSGPIGKSQLRMPT